MFASAMRWESGSEVCTESLPASEHGRDSEFESGVGAELWV